MILEPIQYRQEKLEYGVFMMCEIHADFQDFPTQDSVMLFSQQRASFNALNIKKELSLATS